MKRVFIGLIFFCNVEMFAAGLPVLPVRRQSSLSQLLEKNRRAWREDIEKSVKVRHPQDFNSGFDDWEEIDGDEGSRWDKWDNVISGGYIVEPPISGAAQEIKED